MDYLRHWACLDRPFAHDASQRFFLGSPQREVVAGVSQLVRQGAGLAILVNEGGCGASSLLKYVGRSNGLGDCAVEFLYTTGDQNGADDSLVELAGAFGWTLDQRDLRDRAIAAIEACLLYTSPSPRDTG